MAFVLGNYVKPASTNLQASNPGFGTIAGASQTPSTISYNTGGYSSLTPNQRGLTNPQTQLAGSVQIGANGGTGAAAAPYKPPTTAKIIPISPGPGSNTAGSGATFSDVNSGNANYTPGDSAYAPAQQGTIDANWLQNYLDNDQQYKADLARISAQGGNYLDAFTSAAKAAEIAAGYPFDIDAARKAGLVTPSLLDPVTGQPVSMGPLFDALSDPATQLAAQQNTFSQRAQIAKQYADLLASQDSAMGASGMSRSGDYMNAQGDYSGGYQHQQASYQNDLANYNAMQTFLGNLNTGYANYGTQLQGLQGDLQTARQNDLSKALAMINAGLLKAPSALQNNPGGDSFDQGFGAGSQGTLSAPGITNEQYAASPVGQAMAAAARAAGVSSGAGGVLTSGGARAPTIRRPFRQARGTWPAGAQAEAGAPSAGEAAAAAPTALRSTMAATTPGSPLEGTTLSPSLTPAQRSSRPNRYRRRSISTTRPRWRSSNSSVPTFRTGERDGACPRPADSRR